MLDVLDYYELIEEDSIGRVNVNEEINRKTVEYLKEAKLFLGNKKLKTCESFISDILSDFKYEPFEYLIFKTIKIYCNLRLHNYRYVSSDLNEIGNLDNNTKYRFDNFPMKYKIKKGSMVPFILKLMNCYYPFTLNLFFTSFDRLYLMIQSYEKALNICIQKVGNIRNTKTGSISELDENDINRKMYIKKRDIFLHHIVLTCYVLCDLLLKKDYIQQAIELLQNKILKYDPHHISTISLIGKFSLLMGCCDSAEDAFNLIKCISPQNNHEHIKTNDNFFNFFLEDYKAALTEILTIASSVKSMKDEQIEKEDTTNCVSDYAIFCNNLAVSYFYNADLNSSVQVLENTLGENALNAFPSSVKNLNYFYELCKAKPETVSRINDFIKLNLNEDQEVQVLIPRSN